MEKPTENRTTPKLLGLAAFAALLAMSVSPAFAQSLEYSQWEETGNTTECDDTPANCEGDLITCKDGETFYAGIGKIRFIEGFCDDAGLGASGLPPCEGLFEYFTESCFVTSDGPSGVARMDPGIGEFRTCFDPNGSVDCTDANLTGSIIAGGRFRWQNQISLGASPINAFHGHGNTSGEVTFAETFDYRAFGGSKRSQFATGSFFSSWIHAGGKTIGQSNVFPGKVGIAASGPAYRHRPWIFSYAWCAERFPNRGVGMRTW